MVLRTEGNRSFKAKLRIYDEGTKVLKDLDKLEKIYNRKFYELGVSDTERNYILLSPIENKRRDLYEIMLGL